jgi:hypothetical protein
MQFGLRTLFWRVTLVAMGGNISRVSCGYYGWVHRDVLCLNCLGAVDR